MTKIQFFLGFLGVLLFSVVPAPAEMQCTDVVHLADGKVLEGIIVEEEPGRTLTLLTADQQTSALPISKVVRIEKKLELLDSPIRYRDVVFLTDGVIFRGTIVERVPKQAITLELESGRLLEFKLQEVWKIVAEQVTSAEVRPAALDQGKAEKIKLELQIQFIRRKAELSGRKESQEEAAREEADRLKDELEELEQERKQVEERLAQEEKRKEGVRGEWAPLQAQLQATMGEWEGQLEACGNPEAKDRLEQVYERIRQDVNRLVLQAQTVSLTAQPDPRVEKAAHEQAKTEVLALAANGAWKKKKFRDQLAQRVNALSRAERREVYNASKKLPPLGASALNLIPILSLGSWSQGDVLGATFSTIAAGGGLLLTVVIDTGWPYYLGATVGIGGWVFSVLQPFFRTAIYNNALRTALGLEPGKGGKP